MAEVGVTDLRAGMKIEIEDQPYIIVKSQFVKPGKGQPFAKVKIKHLLNGRVTEKTYKSGETFPLANVEEFKMRLLYQDQSGATFMNDETFEQVTVPKASIEDVNMWLLEDIIYDVIFYKNEPVAVTPPTFMNLKITQTDPGDRGNTASGRVLKPATTENNVVVQVPIFIEAGEIVKIDTRTGEYVSRVNK